MIAIIRMSTNGDEKALWAAINEKKDILQAALQQHGRLLYLTRRVGMKEASLFVHTTNVNSLIDLIATELSHLEGVETVCLTQLFRPRFFPVPRDTSDMKRFVVTLQVNPRQLESQVIVSLGFWFLELKTQLIELC